MAIRQPSMKFRGPFCSHDDYIPSPASSLLTHFAPPSVILVVPDGIDSLRNDEPVRLQSAAFDFIDYVEGGSFSRGASRRA